MRQILISICGLILIFSACSKEVKDSETEQPNIGAETVEFSYGGLKYTTATEEGLEVHQKLLSLPEVATVVNNDGSIELFEDLNAALGTDNANITRNNQYAGVSEYYLYVFPHNKYGGNAVAYEDPNASKKGICSVFHASDSDNKYFNSFVLTLIVDYQVSGVLKSRYKFIFYEHRTGEGKTLIYDGWFGEGPSQKTIDLPSLENRIFQSSPNPCCTPHTYWTNKARAFSLLINQ